MKKTISFVWNDALPLVQEGDDIWKIIVDHFTDILDWDVFVIAQKIVSKAEWRIINLEELHTSDQAKKLAESTWRSAWLCQAIINESEEILESHWKVIVTKMKNGLICTSAGIDTSNIREWWKYVVLLPKDPDESAKLIQEQIEKITWLKIAIIINDSLGHPNRNGSIGMAIWISGIASLEKWNWEDLYWNTSQPKISLVDEIAAWASILMWQWNEGIPVVQVRWVKYTRDEKSSITDTIKG